MIPPTPPTLRDAASLLVAMQSVGRLRVWLALAFLTLGSLTEGMSILLMLPILQLIGGQTGAQTGSMPVLNLGGRDVLGFALPDISLSLTVLLALLVGLVILQAAFMRLRSIFLSDVMHDFTNGVRSRLFAAVAEARWDRIMRFRIADLEHALTGEVERIQMAAMLTLSMVQGGVGLVIYLGICLAISVPMTVFSVVFGLSALFALRPYRRLAVKYGAQLQASRGRQFRTVSDFLAGLKTARSMNREGEHLSAFNDILTGAKEDARSFSRQATTGAGLFQVALSVGAALFILIALQWAQLAASQIVVLLLILMRLAPRFMALQAQAQQLLIDLPAWRQITGLESELALAVDPSAHGRAPVPRPVQDIRLDRVTYRYADDGGAALEDCTIRLRAGEVTALIGPSGSGKSTVADIITGLIRPQTGLFMVDGRSLAPAELRGWRARIAYVPQDSVLLHASIRHHLTSAAPDTNDADLHNALRMAAAEFVLDLPEGLETVTGDRGVLLSGGERQRIALARAFLRKPDVLVLDEATSALDWESQARVAEAVKALAGRVTVLTIAHRPSMVSFAAMIYALDGGRVIEHGRRDDLLANRDGYFSRMVQQEAEREGTVDRSLAQIG